MENDNAVLIQPPVLSITQHRVTLLEYSYLVEILRLEKGAQKGFGSIYVLGLVGF